MPSAAMSLPSRGALEQPRVLADPVDVGEEGLGQLVNRGGALGLVLEEDAVARGETGRHVRPIDILDHRREDALPERLAMSDFLAAHLRLGRTP